MIDMCEKQCVEIEFSDTQIRLVSHYLLFPWTLLCLLLFYYNLLIL
jgi:hypothetical protein